MQNKKVSSFLAGTVNVYSVDRKYKMNMSTGVCEPVARGRKISCNYCKKAQRQCITLIMIKRREDDIITLKCSQFLKKAPVLKKAECVTEALLRHKLL